MNNKIIILELIQAFRNICWNETDLHNEVTPEVFGEEWEQIRNGRRSSTFIKIAANNLRTYINNTTQNQDEKLYVQSESHEKHPAKFKATEFMFDIHICSFKKFRTNLDRADIFYVNKSLVAIESEFSKLIQDSVEDFSKLVSSKAPLKVMILPHKAYEYHTKLKQVAENINESLFLIYLPHPGIWNADVRNDIKIFEYKDNDWHPLTRIFKAMITKREKQTIHNT